MVIPTKRDQVRGICGTSSTPGDDVVDLKAVATPAAIDGATVAVTMDDCPTEGRRDGPGATSVPHR
ncbi:MAG TPA: hypothetical protein VIH55_03495, partial [Acidimicrobiia bacterium]